MEVSKSQALYRALPNNWFAFSEKDKSDYRYAAQIKEWNTKPVVGIHEEMIREDIKRRVHYFKTKGTAFNEFSDDAIDNFQFVEPVMNEGFADIKCKIEPLTFYCNTCGKVESFYKFQYMPTCPNCNKKMVQLQMIFPCKCGYAEGVRPKKSNLLYRGNLGTDRTNTFNFFDKNGTRIDMNLICPDCSKKLYPKNALDTGNFYGHTGSIVNLYNKKYEDVLVKYKENAELLIFAKHFNIITHDEFNNILDNSKDFFEGKSLTSSSPEVLEKAKKFNMPPEMILQILQSDSDAKNIFSVKNEINNILPLTELSDKSLVLSRLIEFDSLKYPKEIMSLEHAVNQTIYVGNIIEEDEIKDYINKLKIANIQVSSGVQIVNYAYGFTRLKSTPEEDKELRLRGFGGKVFTTVLDTEGILVELDMLKVIEWLKENGIVDQALSITNEIDAKKWFMENVRLDAISTFDDVPLDSFNIITKVVYSLLHTISHMMIISAGKHSGINKESIAEKIFPNTCAFYIYPTSIEGVTLGSLPGMFETHLQDFLNDALYDNEICSFDPICIDTQNGACAACTYLSEVSCEHFNKDLSRAYLYGGKVKKENASLFIEKGFWK